MDEILKTAREKMEKSLEVLRRDMAKVRTGRASSAIVEDLKVEYYGTLTPLKSIASISTPDPRTIMISPYDKNALGDIEKAINKSDLGLPPQNDGHVIRLNIPELTEERREQLVKEVRRKGEEGRVSIRNIRREANDAVKKKEKAKELSEDLAREALEKIQKLTDEFIEKVDEIVKHKEKDIMSF